MNILMIVSWYTSMGKEKLEAGVFHYEQSRDLKRFCNVAIYYPFDQEIMENETKEEEWGILTYRSAYKPGRVFQTKRQMRRTMKRIIEEFHPDLIHAHCGGAAGYYGAEFSKKYRLPMVVTEHVPLELSQVDKLGIGRYFTKKAYKTSKANICVSQDLMNKLSKIFPECKFDVIYNGIILPEYREGERRYYQEGYTNIVIVAILYDLEIKGLNYLLKAMQILKKQERKVILHHIGGGEYLDYYKNMARDLEIEDVCRFYGGCERRKLYEIVNEMDFFVSASLFESAGVSVQEAMLLGKPVLATTSGGVESLVPEMAGKIVEKANAEALAQGILYMEENLEKFDREAIRAYAQESFEISHISQKYMELYKHVLKGGTIGSYER